VHLVPFMFHFADRPDLTQKWTRRICADFYDTGSRGLCGAEDEGQMTAWYVLASIGLHPACPGAGVWMITSPVFDEVVIKLDPAYFKGGTFTIRARNNSPENVYIQRASLNGKPLDRAWLRYDEVTAGGVLELEMGRRAAR
jgi:putative alpha-1,2-mannosidase